MVTPLWKSGITPAALHRRRSASEARRERRNKGIVRERDGYCRFPLCGCAGFGFALHVSHATHKGMGGNPTGSVSVPSKMLLLCAWRHREGRFSIDRKTVRWFNIRDDEASGANGLIVWEIFVPAVLKTWPHLHGTLSSDRDYWYPLAYESERHVYDGMTDPQRRLCDLLAEMKR
jgi:hypothetical protein